MADAATIEGHCLCRAVRITISHPKHHVEICHCDMCRRWGGAFYPALTGESFAIAGEDAVTTFQSSSWAERAFCGTCGSNLWYKFLPTGNRSFVAGLFDGAETLGIEKEIFVDEKARWTDLAGDHPRQTGAEVIAEAREAGFEFD
ncbi:GFA family protein [Aurantiacibacter poecillastricola]|uniref:GFA family protein n=1 Tax=Aurantiacibacter poecillastricola TaxID=3064385 RepID=UPI0027402001|nr:GFA family protein [Aurantiacibacter sp. 219JJ12-13]MDP5262652.1 GFA family protein [Aurantiacibacter sp. 219JJ12-13]